MPRFVTLLAVILTLLAPAALRAAAQDATPGAGDSLLAGLGYPELVITTDGTDFDLPAEVEAGRYRVVLENTSELSADLEFYQLPEGVTVDDLMTAFESREMTVPEWYFDTTFSGGAVANPGETGDVILDLTPGEWVANLFTYSEMDEAGPPTNLPKTVTVTGEMPAVEPPADAVPIELVDMDFILPETISAGPQIWGITNTGQQPHHLVLVQVPDGTTEGDVLELINAMFGPPPGSPEAGATPVETALAFEDVTDIFETLVLSTGQSNWLDIDIGPGSYVALCFLPDPSGTPHVMLGMIETFTVE